jgi:superfamily II DNA or RNA helicase
MFAITADYIQKKVADSPVIYQRGVSIYETGSFLCAEADPEAGRFIYEVDGNYGDYTTTIQWGADALETACDCPYPGSGCKHTVAVLLDVIRRRLPATPASAKIAAAVETEQVPFLNEAEIREQAIEDRRKRSRHEGFQLTYGEMLKGIHLVETNRGKCYEVTLHDPKAGRGHCECPDFQTNRLGTCKHLMFLTEQVRKKPDLEKQVAAERFPFVDIFWDSVADQPRLFCERPEAEIADIQRPLKACFSDDGRFCGSDLTALLPLMEALDGNKRVRVQASVVGRLDDLLMERQLAALAAGPFPSLDMIKTRLYPYQEDGIRRGLYRKALLIGDEMGLGKTLQAIALGLLKKEVFGFEKILVVTMASLKEQWKREIERFTDEQAVVVAGSPAKRETTYRKESSLFKITNYEAVLRDHMILARFKPDLVILDEAQRIKNFTTKTADAVKSIPRRHSLVLTGTPLENKLEDVYSIVQFLDPRMLSPLWQFAADHFMLSRDKKGKILGYRNLDKLHQRLAPVVIRRRKAEVLSELPEQIVNNYYVELTDQQLKIHGGYAQLLIPLLNKKFLTPMDLRRIMELLLKMRQVCDSTYLIDRRTNISPKLKELDGILDELVIQNGRKVVIFSEWTSMTFLIARHLSDAGIAFVELSGKIPVNKRQALIDEFTSNALCKAFLSTDAGGTGLNLQAADCVINFELPWNPARMNQRIGRVHRIGQRSGCVNVVNLIAKHSIEEKIYAGIQLKTDLFKGVFDGGMDTVEFSRERRTEMLNRLREMMQEPLELPVSEARPSDEVPEDTPHYLNPEVLSADTRLTVGENEDDTLTYDVEPLVESMEPEPPEAAASSEIVEAETGAGAALGGQSPEKVEAVLNSGMAFLGGLMEMATGQKMAATGDDGKMLHIDRATGEVTLKFKLPGF